jgi:hypothetical protein
VSALCRYRDTTVSYRDGGMTAPLENRAQADPLALFPAAARVPLACVFRAGLPESSSRRETLPTEAADSI